MRNTRSAVDRTPSHDLTAAIVRNRPKTSRVHRYENHEAGTMRHVVSRGVTAREQMSPESFHELPLIRREQRELT